MYSEGRWSEEGGGSGGWLSSNRRLPPLKLAAGAGWRTPTQHQAFSPWWGKISTHVLMEMSQHGQQSKYFQVSGFVFWLCFAFRFIQNAYIEFRVKVYFKLNRAHLKVCLFSVVDVKVCQKYTTTTKPFFKKVLLLLLWTDMQTCALLGTDM